MKNEEFFCNLTAMFWRYYLLEPTREHFEEIFSYFSEQLVMIGTGKHEFFSNMHQILECLEKNQVEAESIRFDVLDEWYECRMLSQDVSLVYGGIWVRQQEENDSEVLIDMDTRFSILYCKQNEKWEIIHVHHSIPYVEQQKGEYYPKTLSEKAKEAMIMAKLFEKKSEMDLMTEVYNNVSFKLHAAEQMNVYDKGNMYLFDLDHFKLVNDTYGHMAGDEILRIFSDFLKQSFDVNAVIGRMGGDEFAVFEYAPLDRELTVQKIALLQKNFENATEKILLESTLSFSVGIASLEKEQYSYEDMFSNADCALYRAKQMGRQTYYWYDE